jgi:hypothetical protein
MGVITKRILSLSFLLCVPCIQARTFLGWMEDFLRFHRFNGTYGRYAINRESPSGTSWQPESSPLEGVHTTFHRWHYLANGFCNGIVGHESSLRGDTTFFSTNMLNAMAQRDFTSGAFAARTMVSAQPLTIEKKGYPLLLQTGGTTDGKYPVIDHQLPMTIFMELSTAASVSWGNGHSFFSYIALPGQPALGPPVFLTRFSAQDNPIAPISYHWLDATNISFGVITAGYIWRGLKIDGSVFTARQANDDRFGFEKPHLDSLSIRCTVNPGKNWSFQASFGHLARENQTEPCTCINRTTASVIYNKPLSKGHWQTMVAWGRNDLPSTPHLDAFLFESCMRFNNNRTLFARAECVQKNKLFLPNNPYFNSVFRVQKIMLGYIYDFITIAKIHCGYGLAGAVSLVPEAIKPYYNGTPLSFLFFFRAKLW